MNRYTRTIHPVSQEGAFSSISIDVYSVLTAFNVTNPATQHAVKKLLCAGERGSKSVHQDLIEARQAIDRAITLVEQTPGYVGEKVLKAMRDDAQGETPTAPAKTVTPEVFDQAKKDWPATKAKLDKAARKKAYQKAYRARKKAQK